MKPILFSTEMVRAILDGSKTQTRRIVKPQPVHSENKPETWNYSLPNGNSGQNVLSKDINTSFLGILDACPYGKPGDWLWVRETWCDNDGRGHYYKADFPDHFIYRWKPSIHMPKSYARIWLEILSVQVEQLHQISNYGAIREGVKKDWLNHHAFRNYLSDAEGSSAQTPVGSFATLWESINGPGSWNANPWVWVVGFKVISVTGKPVDNGLSPDKKEKGVNNA